MATKLTDAQILANLKVSAPWLYATYTSPAFTPEQKKVFVGWARDAAAGKAPTPQQMAAQTYNWPITQIWNDNQRAMFQKSLENPGQYKADLAATQTDIDQLIKTKGLTVDKNTRDRAVNQVLLQGMNLSDPRVIELLTGTYKYGSGLPATGQVSKTIADYGAIAANYGIPLPADPVKMTEFIKGAIGPNGNEQSFTDYAKNIAKAQYPWMSAQIDAGVTPKAYLTPYATHIANTLDLSPDAINWQDPKWSSLLTTKDAKGVSTPSTFNDVLLKVKTDPQYRYDFTTQAKSDAYDLGSKLKSMFGFGA